MYQFAGRWPGATRMVFLLGAVTFFSLNIRIWGQSGSGISVTGQLGYNSQLYNMQSEGSLPVNPRRPGDLHRFMISPVFQAGDFRLPVSIIFSSRQTNAISMRLPDQNFGQFLRNPLNTFRISPSYKWVKLNVGSQIVNYSTLTTGDLKMFGAGFELTPGKWTIAAFSGIARQAIEADSLRRIAGQYKRQFQAVKAGYGNESAFHVFVSAARMVDDHEALPDLMASVKPQEGFAASLAFGIPFAGSLFWQTEVAGSVFTRDKNTGLHEQTKLDEIKPYFDLYHSTRADYSGRTGLTYNRNTWSVKASAVYIGDGFVAPGFPYLETDRFDLTLDPAFRLLENKLVISGSVGYRVNNLSDTRLMTTNQLLAAFNANYAVSEAFGFSASYSNFGIRTGYSFDTLRVEVVSQSFGLAPYVNLTAARGMHRLVTHISYDDFQDNNLVSGQSNNQRSLSTFLNHQFSFNTNPLVTNFSVSYLNSLIHDTGLNYFMLQGGGSYRFHKNNMMFSLNLSYVNSQFGTFTPDNAWLIRPGFRYTLTRQVTARLDGSIRLYSYGSSRPGTSYSENMLRTAINYRF